MEIILIILVVSLLLAWASQRGPSRKPSVALSFVGEVAYACDGDTLQVNWVDGGVRVRLFGIDAPEHGQPFGKEAGAAISSICKGARVQVQGYEYDVYGRLVGEVFLDGESINVAMVRAGLAWALRGRGFPASFAVAEKLARCEVRGLWADPEPMPPWEFRHAQPLKSASAT